MTGDFDTGLAELQRGTNLLSGSDNWELFLQLSCTIAEVHFQRGHFENTLEVSEHILSFWTSSDHNIVFFQALFYLIFSHYRLEQLLQGLSAMIEWTEKLIVDCSLC